MKTIRERLLERKVGQWVLAYVSGAWVGLELLQLVSQQFDWPLIIGQGVIVLVGMGFLVTCVLAWYHGEKGRQRLSGTELLLLTLLLVSAGLVLRTLEAPETTPRPGPTSTVQPPDMPSPNSLAILYFAAEVDDADLNAFAEYLTETLISEFTNYEVLDVRSAFAVERLRGSSLFASEIARLLDVALIVSGRMRRVGDRLLLNVELSETPTARSVWSSAQEAEVGPDGELALVEAIVADLSDALRERLGLEIRSLEWASGTESREAWEILTQARHVSRIALDFLEAGSRDQALVALDRADTLLMSASWEDPSWIEPHLQEARLAERRIAVGFRHFTEDEIRRVLSNGLTHVGHAFVLDPESPIAHFLRGQLTHTRLLFAPPADPDSAEVLERQTASDYLTALELKPTFAAAWARLGLLRFGRGEYRGARTAALRAYEEDAFLEETAQILNVLAQVSFEAGEEAEALNWCREGQRRLAIPMFLECELEILAWGQAVRPEPGVARELATRVQEASSFGTRGAVTSARVNLTLASALARAGLREEALGHLERGVTGAATAEATPDLLLWEAAARARLGQMEAAVGLLRRFLNEVPTAPDHLVTQRRFHVLSGLPAYDALF